MAEELASLKIKNWTALFISQITAQRDLPQDIVDEIKGHRVDVNKIVEYILSGPGKHGSFNKLRTVVDTYGHRLAGSKALEDSIDYILQELRKETFENVDSEEVEFPNWVRGEESLEMLQPLQYKMDMLGLGRSANTSEEGITASVVVVRSFDELDNLPDSAIQGKIVVYNQPWMGYSPSVAYRSNGMIRASKRGAVAALVRSVTGHSLYTPHTGVSSRDNETVAIPTASITVEDAEYLNRLYENDVNITLHLKMSAQYGPSTTSRNVVAEIKGSEYPDQIVMFGGHIDSWDVGSGAMDDGAGSVHSWEVLSVIKALGLTPKRTMRMVMWTAEENGIHGGNQYYERHKNESDKVSLAMESDGGVWKPFGVGFTGSGLARAYMEEILELLEPINASGVRIGGGGADIGMWEGVPTASLWNAADDYFDYHHTRADTLNMIDADELDLCTAVWTAVSYVVADLNDMLPREGDYPEFNSAESLQLYQWSFVFSVLCSLFVY